MQHPTSMTYLFLFNVGIRSWSKHTRANACATAVLFQPCPRELIQNPRALKEENLFHDNKFRFVISSQWILDFSIFFPWILDFWIYATSHQYDIFIFIYCRHSLFFMHDFCNLTICLTFDEKS